MMSDVARAILLIATVAVIGLLIGRVRLRGIGLGSAGVLFAGILVGHFGGTIEPEIGHFAKEFGLVLFVFAIGLQLGPGILVLWRQQGWQLNAMAAAVVLQGVGLVLLAGWLLDFDVLATAGLFSGATTNTPSLGAAQQAASGLSEFSDEDLGRLSSAYAVAYPGAIIGIIATMLVMRWALGVSIAAEAEQLSSADGAAQPQMTRRCLIVDNPRLSGMKFGDLPGLEETGVRISRLRRAGEERVQVATDQSQLRSGDLIQVVGSERDLNRFCPLIGSPSDVDLMASPSNVDVRRIVITSADLINKTLRELALDQVYDVTVTRIRRSGVEMPARGSTRFSYGDVVTIVGETESLDRVAKVLGNSVKSLDETQFAPLFFGIAVGVLLGIVPFNLPGVPFPVQLGLAGGPLLTAIVLSIIGRLGPLVWYVPYSANLALRELGIILFLACAGIAAGQTFFDVALTSRGALWMAVGFGVTTIPLVTTALVARFWGGMNYLTICGVVAGSMTDPPALAFANSMSDSSGAATAYAAVYPLTMMLRIIAAQTIVYLLG